MNTLRKEILLLVWSNIRKELIRWIASFLTLPVLSLLHKFEEHLTPPLKLMIQQYEKELILLFVALSLWFFLILVIKYKDITESIDTNERFILQIFKQFDFSALSIEDIKSVNRNVTDVRKVIIQLCNKDLIDKEDPNVTKNTDIKYQLTDKGYLACKLNK